MLRRSQSAKLARRFLVVFRTELIAEESPHRRAPRVYATISRGERLVAMCAVARGAGAERRTGCQAYGGHDLPPDA
jgi:hypothetical protein